MPRSYNNTPLTTRQKFLVLKNKGMAFQIARDLWYQNGGREGMFWRYGMLEDFEQEALRALLLCARGFKSALGYKFTSYAWPSIKQALVQKNLFDTLISSPAYLHGQMDHPYKPASDLARNGLILESALTSTRRRQYFEFAAPSVDNDLPLDIAEFLTHLDKREQRVLRDLYWEAKPVPAIARREHVSRQRVYSIRNEALSKLRTLVSEAYT